MSISQNINSYSDCEEAFNAAIGQAKGVRIHRESKGHATRFMQRLNTYRTLLRKQSKEIYENGDARYNASIYDPFIVRRDSEDESAVVIEPFQKKDLRIEVIE